MRSWLEADLQSRGGVLWGGLEGAKWRAIGLLCGVWESFVRVLAFDFDSLGRVIL